MGFRSALAPIAVAAAAACRPEGAQLGTAGRSADAAPSAPTPASAAPVAACFAASDPRLAGAMREDLDGDGKPDWIVQRSYEVDLFVDRSGCAEDRGVLRTQGPLAFVHVGPVDSAGAMRDLHVDTWLHHGDRAQYVYAWSGGSYAMKSRGRDIIEGRPP